MFKSKYDAFVTISLRVDTKGIIRKWLLAMPIGSCCYDVHAVLIDWIVHPMNQACSFQVLPHLDFVQHAVRCPPQGFYTFDSSRER